MSMAKNKIIIGIDPGREKCGLALLDIKGEPLILEVIAAKQVPEYLFNLLVAHHRDLYALVMGKGTYHKELVKNFKLSDKFAISAHGVDYSSQEGLPCPDFVIAATPVSAHAHTTFESLKHRPPLPFYLVDEYGTTLAARSIYWRYNKPSWWQNMLPVSWRSTPELDAYAALVIARQWLNCLE